MNKKSPIKLMIIIVYRDKTKEVLKLLQKRKINHHIIMLAKGTAPSEIQDIFSFGIIDRDVITCFVETEKSEYVLKLLYRYLKLDKEHNGVAFTTEVDAISSDLFEKVSNRRTK